MSMTDDRPTRRSLLLAPLRMPLTQRKTRSLLLVITAERRGIQRSSVGRKVVERLERARDDSRGRRRLRKVAKKQLLQQAQPRNQVQTLNLMVFGLHRHRTMTG